MKTMFNDLIKSRELLWAFTLKNIKIKYKQTAMGFLWALFMPAMIVLSGIIVKKAMAMFSGKPLELSQIVTVSVKALPWAFFITALKFAVSSLVTNMNLVQKIYFPREVLPISFILSQMLDFFIASSVLAIILAFAGLKLSIYLLWLPLLIVFLISFTSGLSLLLSCANLFFRDVKYIVEVILMFGIFFTPVFYEASLFGKWGTLLLLNPVGAILENINAVVVLNSPPDYLWLIYTGVASVGTLILGWSVFKKAEPAFAENI